MYFPTLAPERRTSSPTHWYVLAAVLAAEGLFFALFGSGLASYVVVLATFTTHQLWYRFIRRPRLQRRR